MSLRAFVIACLIGAFTCGDFGFVSASFSTEANARPICYRAKNCAGRIGFNDKHNCTRRGGKSWRPAARAKCQNI